MTRSAKLRQNSFLPVSLISVLFSFLTICTLPVYCFSRKSAFSNSFLFSLVILCTAVGWKMPETLPRPRPRWHVLGLACLHKTVEELNSPGFLRANTRALVLEIRTKPVLSVMYRNITPSLTPISVEISYGLVSLVVLSPFYYTAVAGEFLIPELALYSHLRRTDA